MTTMFRAAVQMPGSDSALELDFIVAEEAGEAAVREAIASQLPGEVIILGIFPVASDITVEV